MADIPPPHCFGLSSGSVEPSTPSSHSEVISIAPAIPHHVHAPSQPPEPTITLLTVPHSTNSIPLLSSSSPVACYPFYFNNFPATYNSHLSSPLNVPPSVSQDSVFRLPGHRVSNSTFEVVSQTDLVHYTLMGLGWEYETLVTTLTHLPLQLTFDDLRHACCSMNSVSDSWTEMIIPSTIRLLPPNTRAPLRNPHPTAALTTTPVIITLIVAVVGIIIVTVRTVAVVVAIELKSVLYFSVSECGCRYVYEQFGFIML
ncbi:hypothetical protein Cgig2_026152 [Carnegiea gigantea]|uniref:Uncharacterized protein n=1 Tax=Carnegiea gigantea TaxID=171969 RepID=A0A9Q1Q3R0_9CARY|nr:hypothetical protein Cgig2_026152 [Carnegiea gigantea]